MHPILFKLGPLTLYTYGAAMAAGFLVSIALAAHVTKRQLRGSVPLPDTALVDWGCWTMLGGILGGRLLYVLLNWEVYRAHPLEILALWHGGLVWYGGLVGGLLAHAGYVRAHHYPFLSATDQLIPFIALGHAIGRLGCFANGCCYGRPTTAWFGVVFPGDVLAVVPTQLFESASLLVLYVLLRRLQTPLRLRQPGAIFGSYLVGYALIRWTLERWRADQPIVWVGWTLHQFISLLAFGIGMTMLIKAASRPHRLSAHC